MYISYIIIILNPLKMDLFVLILILSRGHHGMQNHLSINMGIKPDPKLDLAKIWGQRGQISSQIFTVVPDD